MRGRVTYDGDTGHGFLRAWLRKFGGVSKHYLRNYISFFELLFNSKETSIYRSVPDGLGDERTFKTFPLIYSSLSSPLSHHPNRASLALYRRNVP